MLFHLNFSPKADLDPVTLNGDSGGPKAHLCRIGALSSYGSPLLISIFKGTSRY